MSKIVHCRLGGGLGNQLFRYATARALSLELDADSVFEVGGFQRDSFGREYLLDSFEGPRRFRKTHLRDGRLGRLWFRLQNRKACCLLERDFPDRAPEASDAGHSRRIALEGYWQSEIYFKKHQETILEELRFSLDLDDANRAWVDAIEASSEPVAIHFRSYGEVSGSMAGKVMGKDYYSAACNGIRERLPEAEFFLFTDDADAAAHILDDDYSVRLVDANSGGGEQAGVRDLYLMSRCRHFITANSSFSWWGAWLSQNVYGEWRDRSNRFSIYPCDHLSHSRMVPKFGFVIQNGSPMPASQFYELR